MLLTLGLAAPALAQQDHEHTVQPGDNLYDLAQRFLDDPREWPQLQRINRVSDPRRLRPGTRLVIPATMARPAPAQAEVLHVAGQVQTRAGHAQAEARPLEAGGRLDEGAQIDVGDEGFVTLRLADGSVVRLAAGTQVRLRELRHAPAPGHTQSGLQLERGRVDATVSPLPTRRSRFEVRTPRAVGGVRGTTFGVAVAGNGDFIGDVREGSIQVQPTRTDAASAMLLAGQGARVGERIVVAPLLGPPDLSGVPAVVEDIARIDLPLPEAAGVSAWQVRIASDAASHQVLRNGTFEQPRARFDGLDDGDYLLAVRALDGQGIPGVESVRRLTVNARPTAPLLREPRAGARVIGSSVELLCTEGAGVVGYLFEVARDASFEHPLLRTPDLPTCQQTLSALAPGAYAWRVAAVARDAQGQRDQGPFSAPVPFQVVALPPAPEVPRLSEQSTGGLGVSWSASPGGPWRHQIQLAHDDTFSRLLDDQRLEQPAFTRAMPPAGSYHVRVRQIDTDGLVGPWSVPQRLEVHGQVTTTDAQPLTSSDGRPIRPGAR